MNKLITFASISLLAGALSAQTTGVSIAGGTVTDMDVAVQINRTSDTDSVAQGTRFTKPVGAKAGVRGGHASAFAGYGKRVDFRTRQTIYFASLGIDGNLYGMDAKDVGKAAANDGTGSATQRPGPMKVKYVFSAPARTKGNFMLTLGGHASANGNVALALKFGQRTLTWKKGEKPVKVEVKDYVFSGDVDVELWATGGATLTGRAREGFSGKAGVSFVAEASSGGTCTITKGAAGCSGDLDGKVESTTRGKRVACTLTGAVADSLGITLLSPDGNLVRFGGCGLFSNVGALLTVFKIDSNGDAKHGIQLPMRGPLTVWIQDATLSFGSTGLDIKTSNDLKIECK